MNIKHLLTCFFLLAMLVSCEEIGKQLRSNDIDDGTTSMIENEEGDTLIDDGEEESGSAMPLTKTFYNNLLENFCQKYFDEKFEGDHYLKSSLVVVKINQKGDSTMEVSGTHSYKVSQGTEVKGQMYKAVVSAKGDNSYRVKFEKGSSKIFSDNSYWDSIEEDITFQ